MARSPGALPKWSSGELTCLKKTLVENSTEVEWTRKNVKGKMGFVIIVPPSVSVTVCLSLSLIDYPRKRERSLATHLTFSPVFLFIDLHLSLSRHAPSVS